MADELKFTIKDSVSVDVWEPKPYWGKFKQGLETGAGGVKEAINEAYLVVPTGLSKETKGSDLFGLHHEVRKNGDIVLNKFALQKAVADLHKDETLSEDQREVAKTHLLRHYEELGEDPPKSLTETQADTLMGEMSGEVEVDKIPLSESAREAVEKLIEGDENPCWVAVEIEEGKGGHGIYKASALESIVRQVNSDEPMGYIGHQRPEDLPYEFPEPTTHWLAAEMVYRGGKAVAKVYGLIDQKYQDLRRWVRARRIKQVSIFGKPTFTRGTRDVVDYDLLSIDWTPRNRAGMTTRLLWASEMAGVVGEFGGSMEDLRELLRKTLNAVFPDHSVHIRRLFNDVVVVVVEKGINRKLLAIPYVLADDGTVEFGEPFEVEEQIRTEYVPLGEMDGSYEELQQAIRQAAQDLFEKNRDVWIRRLYKDHVILQVYADNKEELYYFDYKVVGDEIEFSNKKKVTEQVEYVPVGEYGATKGAGEMDLKEMLAGIRSALAKKETTLVEVLGEIGFTEEQVVEQLAGEELAKHKTSAEFGANLARSLGLTAEMKPDDAIKLAGEMAGVWKALGFDENKPENPLEVAGEMRQNQEAEAQKAQDALLKETIAEKVTGEQAQALVSRMITVADGATKEEISGEIDALLQDETLKGILGKSFVDKPPVRGQKQPDGSAPTALRTRSTSI